MLTLKNLSISFQSNNDIIQAVNNSSLTINQGQFVGLVGESGSGKSVTALSILDLLPSTASVNGDIIWKGNKLNTENDPVEIELPDYNNSDGSTVTKRIWENGDSCVIVSELRVNGGGHDWPGSFGNMDINSDTEIWNFVSNFSINGLIDDCSLNLGNTNLNGVSYFPNPVENQLTINNSTNSKKLKITDTKGRLVNDFDLVEGINTVNLDNLPEGNFFFNVGNKTFKIIKAAN